MSAPLRVLGVHGSPHVGGRTDTAMRAILAGAESAGARIDFLELSTHADELSAAVEAADAVVFGSPVYRARGTALLKSAVDSLGRGMTGDVDAPLQGKAAAIVQTGASPHHFLALEEIRSVLAGFFAVQVLSPGLYFHRGDFVSAEELNESAAEVAATHGAALVDLATAVRASARLSAIRPQV